MNTLYPVFLKTNKLNILIVGGGNVGLEKLGFLLKSSPDSNVELIGIEILEDIRNHMTIISELLARRIVSHSRERLEVWGLWGFSAHRRRENMRL